MEKALFLIDSTDSADHRRLLQWLPNLVGKLRQWRASRNDYDILENFSDTDLKDIGLSRCDLLSIRTGEMFRDDSRRMRWL
ncbi:MAG: DUF1127 domain-containing protein [Betaproteobacteria bacterium]|nr:DUF1127 domain-containing protein [Betaproteobacteria bacterium]